jgi:hypothetical protein
MSRKRISLFFGVVLVAMIGFVLNTSSAWAHKNSTVAGISFSSNPAVAGIPVTITGTVVYDGTQSSGNSTGHPSYPNNGTPITTGSIQIQQLRLNGNPVACGTAGAAYVNFDQGLPNGSGQFSTIFPTIGLGGQTIGFRTHHPDSGGPHGDSKSKSECYNLQIILALDPLPDGTASYTQGFYGSSPIGEAVVEYLMDEITCVRINYILEKVGVEGTPYDCYTAIPLLLTGTVGPGKDNGFLPSGFQPGQNIAAQMITLLLNLNLAYVLPDSAMPMYGSFYINIDVVEDLFGDPPTSSVPPTYVDPVLNIPELGSCTDANADAVCDAGTVILTTLGYKVTDLDAAGTTIQNILDAVYSLLASGDTTVVVNGVTLTRGDVTQILGLINESYDEGVATGFVTAFDAD